MNKHPASQPSVCSVYFSANEWTAKKENYPNWGHSKGHYLLLSIAAAWVCQWLHYTVRGWSLNVHSQWLCKYDRKSRKPVERNIHASQIEEHRSLLHDYTFPIKKWLKKGVETWNSCDARHRTLSPAAQGQISYTHCAGTQHVLPVLQFTLCTWIGLFIYHKYGRQLSEISYSPF